MLSLCSWAGALQSIARAHAQAFPNRPIWVVVPFPAGGPTDGMARIISDRLGAVLGQNIIVENRGGGAGGSIGAKFVATADPDGYTLLITPGGALTTGPAVHSNIGYDPVKAFVPVGQLIDTPQVVVAHPDVPVKTLAELVAYAKANPGKIAGVRRASAPAPHLLAELFKLDAGVNIVHVPYRGTAPMLAAIVAGEVQMVADPMTTVLPHIQSGKLRPLAITSATAARIAGCPDRDRGRLSQAASNILARRGGTGRDASRIIQKLNPRSAKACSGGDARAARHARRRDQDRHASRIRKHARRRAGEVDRRRKGRQHQSGMIAKAARQRMPQRRRVLAS